MMTRTFRVRGTGVSNPRFAKLDENCLVGVPVPTNSPPELPPAWIGQIRVLGYGFTSQAGAVGRPALGSGIRSEAPLAPSLATFDRPAATPGTSTTPYWNLTGEAPSGPRKR